MVYLAGKDEQGKTIQLEEDGMTHQHKYKARRGKVNIRQHNPQHHQQKQKL